MNTQAKTKDISGRPARPSPRRSKKGGVKNKVVDVRVTNSTFNAAPLMSRTGMMTFESGRPFWMMIPVVLWSFVRLCFLPVLIIKGAIETALSAVMLAIFLGIGAWALGMVSNPQVADFLVGLGDRALELARLMGLPY